MYIYKTDKKTGKKYRITVPDRDIPVVPVNPHAPVAPIGMGVDLSISSNITGSV